MRSSPPRLIPLGLLALFGLALALRLINLQNPPLDFHPTRQLRSAILARGMYYADLPEADPISRQTAIALAAQMEVLEPPLIERLVALSYRLIGSEQVWLARLYTIAFWLAGGAVLYDFARRLVSPIAGLASAAFYLFFPFGVYASRSFQPDSLMVFGLILSAAAIYRWSAAPNPKSAFLAGLSSGATALIKIQAMPILAAMLAAQTLIQTSPPGWRKRLLSPQPWLMAALFILPPTSYYLTFAPQTGGWLASWQQQWVDLLFQPSFYMRWLLQLDQWVGLPVLLTALLGALLLPPQARLQAVAWWGGYALLGLAFPYHILTHNYYHLPLIPLIGLCLAPLADALLQRIAAQPPLWRWAAAIILLIALIFPIRIASSTLAGRNDRPEALGWQRLAESLPQDGKIIALSHDYGFRLMYFGWREIGVWDPYDPLGSTADTQAFQTYFLEKTQPYRYFLITLPEVLDRQSALKQTLYDHFLLLQDDGSLLLFDLNQPAGHP